MRSTMLAAVSLMACQRAPRDSTIIDVGQLAAAHPAAAHDLEQLIHDRLPMLSRCADPVRELVRHADPGYGSIPIVVAAAGRRGRAVEIRAVSVTPRLPPTYDACMTAAFLGTGAVPTISTGDYSLTVRLHMCVDPMGPP